MLIKTREITTALVLISMTAMAASNASAAGREGHDALRSTLSATAVKQLKQTAPDPVAAVRKNKTVKAEDRLGVIKARLEKSRERAKAMAARAATRHVPGLKGDTGTGPNPWPQNPTYETNPSTGIPRFFQVGGFRAFVPMVHGECGGDCYQHVLANQNGNKEVNAKISMSCPAGELVDNLYYVVNGEVSMQFIASPTENSVSFDVIVEPWTANDFQVTGNIAFGGNWAEAPDENAISETAIAQMTDIITVIGACTNGGSIVEEYQATTEAGFKDLDYNS